MTLFLNACFGAIAVNIEIVASYTKLLIPHLVVDENNAELKTTLISLEFKNVDRLR